MVKSTLDRIGDIVRSNVNELLDKIEDPEKLVRQMIRDMDEAVDAAVASVGKAVANQRRLERDHADHLARAVEFQENAARAVASGSDELGRQCLERKVHHTKAAEDLKSTLEESRRTADQLREHLRSLREGLQDARNRQGSLIARCQVARMRGNLRSGEAPEAPSDPFGDFKRLEKRIYEYESEFERLRQHLEIKDAATQAEADLRRELSGAPGPLDRQLNDLEAKKRVDEELARLRGELAASSEEKPLKDK